jgi:hypothetical protein
MSARAALLARSEAFGVDGVTNRRRLDDLRKSPSVERLTATNSPPPSPVNGRCFDPDEPAKLAMRQAARRVRVLG